MLEFAGITRRFGATVALQDVSFAVQGGSVHALLGENGAGKSTLLRVLSGACAPDQGQVRIAGAARVLRAPADAFAVGIAVIYQELHLVPALSVAENLLLGHLPARLGIVDRGALRARAQALLADVAPELDPDQPVGRLPIGLRQLVEIVKALSRGARVLALDEPTSSLSQAETQRLFAVVRRLRAAGCAVLYVTHRMDEVAALCDAATVLRDGRHVRTFTTLAGVDRDELVRAMVGRAVQDVFGWRPRPPGATLLQVEGLAGPGLRAPVSLRVAAGEIVGVFGLVGAGRTELLRLLIGATPRTAGTVTVAGQVVAPRGPRAALAAGLALCPEDRRGQGIVPAASVAENLNLAARRRFVLDPAAEAAGAATQIARLRIKTASAAAPIRTLSGGNQQKTLLGRWLQCQVRVLLLDEPTRGVDVGARSEIYALLLELAAQGLAVLFVTSDLPEALGIADRVLVLRQGRLAGELPRAAATPEAVLQLALPQAEAVA